LGTTFGPQIGQFQNLDATRQVEQFIAFLDEIERLPQSIALRERSYELLQGQPGEQAIDVGCGTGRAVAELSVRDIYTIGIDISQHMLATAHSRFPDQDFRLASAMSLPFVDGSLNLYRSERVYQYLAQPEEALLEARRVLAPGGRIVLLDPDADMWAIDADDQDTTRVLIRAMSDTIANRWSGRRYHNLLLDTGFVDVTVEVKTAIFTEYRHAPQLPGMASVAVAAGLLTQEKADAWLAEQQHRAVSGRFLMAMPIFLASARRP
jgi:ubiquinone/menaquinone biosynthesis C-methylase UbiE